MNSDVMNIEQAAAYLNLSVDEVQARCREKRIAWGNTVKNKRFHRAELDRFLTANGGEIGQNRGYRNPLKNVTHPNVRC